MRFLGHYLYSSIVSLAAVEAVASIVAASMSVLIPIGRNSIEGAPSASLLPWAPIFSASVLIGITSVGLYQIKQRLHIEGVVVRIVVGLGIAAIIVAVINFFFSLGIPKSVWALSFGVCFVLLTFARVVLWRWVDHETFQRRVLIYGAGDRAASLLKLRRRSDRRGFNIVAFVPAPGETRKFSDERITEIVGSLVDYAQANKVDEIVVAMDDRRQGFPTADLLKCRFAGISVVDLLGFLERETGRVKVDLVNPAWLIFSEGFDTRPRPQLATIAFDLLCSVLLVILTSPLMLIVAIALVIDDGRPILYRQQRTGLMGRSFTLYKFRSMVKNAEADGTVRWAGLADSRVTRVGKVIRKLRLDELPQLLNVLRGDMSIVGPRPERPEFVERLAQKIPYYHERHSVKPGITGWAQLCYPYGSSDDDAMEKLQFDLYYIKHKSLIFDLMVLLQTAEVVLWGKGAR